MVYAQDLTRSSVAVRQQSCTIAPPWAFSTCQEVQSLLTSLSVEPLQFRTQMAWHKMKFPKHFCVYSALDANIL